MKIVKGLGKIIAAGVLAIVILSGILCFYSLTPVHIENPLGNTDYVWPSNSHWVKMTEGIAWGKFDAQGFNNQAVIENPDIIILGSSHMEATNVMQDENTGYLLNQMLDGNYSVYNMGISSHDFFKVCQYLSANLEMYETPPKVVVIETSTVQISRNNVKKVLKGSIEHMPSPSTGLVGTLQKIPFFRLIYQQVQGGLLNLFMPARAGAVDDTESDKTTKTVKKKQYKKLFNYLASIEEQYGTEIIIFYHPEETFHEDGTIEFDNSKSLSAFASAAEKKGITFIDLTDSFEKMYYESHHVPHGFATGEIGTGHLNAYGHAVTADALYETIMKLEEEGKLCR